MSLLLTSETRGGRVRDAREAPLLAVLMPMVWSVRNVVHAGVLDELQAGGLNVCLVTPGGAQPVPAGGQRAKPVCYPMLGAQPSFSRSEEIGAAIACEAAYERAGFSSHRIAHRWLRSKATTRRRALDALTRAAARLATGDAIVGRLARWSAERWERAHCDLLVEDQLRAIRPDAMWATLWGLAGEEAYVVAARALGIPIMASIVGFDNPYTKGLRPVFDRLLVWNDAMKTAVLRLYGGDAEQEIVETGTPQFDFHLRQDLIWTRQHTLGSLGLPPDARYVLYGASHPLHTPDEPRLVSALVKRLRSAIDLADVRFVVRVHPFDRTGRWSALREAGVPIGLQEPFTPHCDGRGWSVSSLDDQALFVNTLRHADACLSIASTIALDAAVLDVPSIALEFGGESELEGRYFFEEYGTDYYRPLATSGGLAIAHGWSEVVAILRRAREDRMAETRGRAAMVRHVCGVVDGRRKEAVAREVADFTRVAAQRRVTRGSTVGA